MEVADVPPALRERLGPNGTAGLLGLFATAHQEWTADVTTAAVERFERRLTEEAANWRVALAQTEAALRLEMRDGDARLREKMRELGSDLRSEMASLRQEHLAGRFELLKWCFVFWVGQVFAVAGVVAVVFRLMQT